MFHQMISKARDQWLASAACPTKDLVQYIEHTDRMRDAQIDAIKTYLFLKIACGCKPLAQLFTDGVFNTADIGELPLPDRIKAYLRHDPAAAALLEYARLKNDLGEQVSETLEKQIAEAPDSIDCARFFQTAFYSVSYTDYLFSLPMGAGKTYLMAAFIYLDLYFAMNEPQNPAFAHNFIIFAPSGLKSSVVPSLRTIQRFDPAWVIPEPAASEIRRRLSFEVLDQSKTANKSNKTKNPNVQKIANHQPLSELFGLVAVTNAEKVIYDRMDKEDMQLSLFKKEEQEQIRQSKELREIIGKIPHLSIFIDEVHHASAAGDSKLRAVVERWTEHQAVNSVVGFSGTPYLAKAEKITVTDSLSVATAEITNIVYHYPLIDGVGNFLKHPVIKIADLADSARIIENGVREFLGTYKDTVYQDGTTAKLGIYCSTIRKLEELVFPLVSRIAAEYDLPGDAILRFYRGNKQYSQPADSQMQFDILDKPVSKIRIVLLVQIGKEGWDCRSLTGIILSQEGDCPPNMVLQTSCRCLRQVDRGRPETALIYLNRANADKLNAQLQQQHHISLQELGAASSGKIDLNRYDRTAYLKLPKVDFYQLKVSCGTATVQEPDPAADIPHACDGAKIIAGSTITTDLSMQTLVREMDDGERGDVPASFDAWLYHLARSSVGTLPIGQLKEYTEPLQKVFETITHERAGSRYFSSHYDRALVEANIRKAFCEKRTCATREELVPEEASLLKSANFRSAIHTDNADSYYPKQETVENIILDDRGKLKPDKNTLALMQLAQDAGKTDIVEMLKLQTSSHPQKDRSFHYLPYRTDSSFERKFMDDVLPFLDGPSIKPLGLELYYNGDDTLTEFQIRCYKSTGGKNRYIGMYTPDFLILQRRDGRFHKVLIVETKGALYANDPKFKDKRSFTESMFIGQNNAKFGYDRFDYLYLEDTLSEQKQLAAVHDKICAFFTEE